MSMTDKKENGHLIRREDIDQILQDFSEELTGYSPKEQSDILRAARLAQDLHREQSRASGEPYIIHPLAVARILINLKLDAVAVIAGLLHDILEDTNATRSQISREFGKEAAMLVNGVTKISIVNVKNKSVQEAETIRKMFFAMVKDIRVILIKLADKRHNMNTLEYLPRRKQKTIANECLDIYAPLAGKLGIYWLKSELEDLALKHLHPEIFQEIKEHIAQRKSERADYLKKVETALYNVAGRQGIKIKVNTRAKHFYSIYLKMKQKGKPLAEIYDLLGIRVLCQEKNDCYTLLGITHNLWKPIDGRFKDYIAMPKENGYQSLHTTVMGYGGRPTEIQIRTFEMNRTAEYGVAAHWVYKDQTPAGHVAAKDLTIMNKLRSWNGKKLNSKDFLSSIKKDLLEDSIYVFTPQGDIVELPAGSTAIDFAYHIHTDVGNHCITASADSQILPLNEPLKNTQKIEITTSPNAHPHLNWLRSVRTARARAKIRQWLNQHDENVIIDRSIVARREAQAKAAQRKTPPADKQAGQQKTPSSNHMLNQEKVGVRIDGERNLMIRLAQCCHPNVGDDIIGFISRGRGIIVHRKDCPNLQSIPNFEERKIQVEWEMVSPKKTFRFQVKAHPTQDLFSEIEGAMRKLGAHLISGQIRCDGEDGKVGSFTAELENRGDLRRVLKGIRTIPSVINALPLEENRKP